MNRTARLSRPADLAAADLRAAADWLAAHPDLPPIFSINRYDSAVDISIHVVTDAEADALRHLTDDDCYRNDHRYDAGEFSRIATGRLGSDRLSLSVAVPR